MRFHQKLRMMERKKGSRRGSEREGEEGDGEEEEGGESKEKEGDRGEGGVKGEGERRRDVVGERFGGRGEGAGVVEARG